jgi:hypothetical protein
VYSADLYLGDAYHDIDIIDDAIQIEVVVSDIFGTGQLPPASGGSLCIPATFAFTAEHPSGRSVTAEASVFT